MLYRFRTATEHVGYQVRQIRDICAAVVVDIGHLNQERCFGTTEEVPGEERDIGKRKPFSSQVM